MFRIHKDCGELFTSFSKYTPLNPLEKQAMSTTNKPKNWEDTGLSTSGAGDESEDGI